MVICEVGIVIFILEGEIEVFRGKVICMDYRVNSEGRRRFVFNKRKF